MNWKRIICKGVTFIQSSWKIIIFHAEDIDVVIKLFRPTVLNIQALSSSRSPQTKLHIVTPINVLIGTKDRSIMIY